MKSFNVICGLPRAGSTLLCNILNQNPTIWASSTSVVPHVMTAMVNQYSNSPEVKSLLINNRYNTELRITTSIKGMIEGWYTYQPNQIIFDKARVWNNYSLLLKNLYPSSLILCMVRDPRNVFASIEKQHKKNPMFDIALEPAHKTVYARADEMLSPNGLIGNCILGVEDLLTRLPSNLLIIRYEELSEDPENVVLNIYHRLNIMPYKHNYSNIENTSEDVDALYLNKYEHAGEGSVKNSDKDEWKQYLSPDLGELIISRYPKYSEVLGYK